MVQGLDLVLLQLPSAHPRSLHQNRKRTEVRSGAWLLPGATDVLSVPESVQAAAPGLFYFILFLKRKAKSLETHSTENRTGRGLEPIGKNFGDIPKPINLFIWEGGGGVGREERG